MRAIISVPDRTGITNLTHGLSQMHKEETGIILS